MLINGIEYDIVQAKSYEGKAIGNTCNLCHAQKACNSFIGYSCDNPWKRACLTLAWGYLKSRADVAHINGTRYLIVPLSAGIGYNQNQCSYCCVDTFECLRDSSFRKACAPLSGKKQYLMRDMREKHKKVDKNKLKMVELLRQIVEFASVPDQDLLHNRAIIIKICEKAAKELEGKVID